MADVVEVAVYFAAAVGVITIVAAVYGLWRWR
jgi:hypothetical protein